MLCRGESLDSYFELGLTLTFPRASISPLFFFVLGFIRHKPTSPRQCHCGITWPEYAAR